MHDHYIFEYLYLEIEENSNYDQHPNENQQQNKETYWEFKAYGEEEINS